MVSAAKLRFGEVYRYAASKDPVPPAVDGFPNFHHITQTPGAPRVQLESGIDVPALCEGADGKRRPVVLIRSSPWKAGSEQTPWHDVFDLDNGHLHYFGDHKAEIDKPLGGSPGNRALLEEQPLHQALSEAGRARATPLLIFRSVTRRNRVKGHVEFCGLGVIERAERVVQRDRHGQVFVNYVFDIALLDLRQEEECIDWGWINARRDGSLTLKETHRLAPESWRRWIKEGHAALPKLRRRVAAKAVHKTRDQRPLPGSRQERDLKQIYEFFDGRKHDFEHLAAAVAARVIRGKGAEYREGWLTRPSADGGADFVGRLDIGSGTAIAKLIVLGQAKCVLPNTTISADQVARVVARLQRGWIGVFVTTGVFSESAQAEIVEDRYPIILVNGLLLAEQLRHMANESHAGDLVECMTKLVSSSPAEVMHRRPEEILLF
ncbi:restriction endonuclease [Actinomadura violacea]|uniref:Restriction endonuclease n=1 Tax=Actinomadura violacea TaxID=2819934 RepID=A0ABS3RXG9_9ACTN|nr:restriction endonuclease [Actinomadura violacea]MBO2461445.1 restriction endonuclease [Actinomadura violacea]